MAGLAAHVQIILNTPEESSSVGLSMSSKTNTETPPSKPKYPTKAMSKDQDEQLVSLAGASWRVPRRPIPGIPTASPSMRKNIVHLFSELHRANCIQFSSLCSRRKDKLKFYGKDSRPTYIHRHVRRIGTGFTLVALDPERRGLAGP